MTDRTPHPGAPWRNFYGRQHGKTLRARHREYLAQDLDGLSPGAVSVADNPDRNRIDLGERFAGKPVWLEIGFGGGEHLVHQAALRPEVAIIGCEPFVNGVAKLLGLIRDAGVDNVAVYPGDVRDLFDVLPTAGIERVFLLYPDPWPKRRHLARRFMNATYLDPLARVMARGAIFRVATDIDDYGHRTLQQVPRYGFELIERSSQPWDDWIATRYENKARREGRCPQYLTFRRG